MEIKNTIEYQINQAKLGNQNAYTILLDTYWAEVYSFMLKRTENEIDTEDIVIETFAKAFDKIHQYQSEFAFNTWLIAIAKNVHVDFLRRKKIEIQDIEQKQAYSILDDSPTIEDKLIIEQNLAELLADIKQLKPAYQEIIQLRYFKEMSYIEIANTKNESINNVKIKLLRAKKLLANIIQKHK